jgi:hypothetical protein
MAMQILHPTTLGFLSASVTHRSPSACMGIFPHFCVGQLPCYGTNPPIKGHAIRITIDGKLLR